MSKYIFISYSNKNESIANDFANNLRKYSYRIFLASQTIRIGDEWVELIEKALNEVDIFLVLLSMESLESDMVTEEIKRARRLYDINKKPRIFPIRINLPFDYNVNYDIAGYLNCFQQRLWQNLNDTELICQEIYNVLQTSSQLPTKWKKMVIRTKLQLYEEYIPIPNAPLEVPGGQVKLGSPFYIKRKGEDEYINKILYPGVLLKIKAPRQYGKTSLLSRIGEFAQEQNHLVIALSFQQIEEKILNNLEALLQRICYEITRKAGLHNRILEFWEDKFLDNKGKCTDYFEKYLLDTIAKPLVLILDEADNLFSYADVYKDFFSILRFWNEKGKNEDLWKKLKIAIVYSTESYLLLDINQSPFNVGFDYNPEMFTQEQINNLARLHGLHLNNTQIEKLIDLISGHPYLIRKALHILAQGETFDRLIDSAPNDNGPFHDHLIRFQWTLSQHPDYSKVFKHIIYNKDSHDTLINDKLRAAGLIIGATPNVKPAFKLYEMFFKDKL